MPGLVRDRPSMAQGGSQRQLDAMGANDVSFVGDKPDDPSGLSLTERLDRHYSDAASASASAATAAPADGLLQQGIPQQGGAILKTHGLPSAATASTRKVDMALRKKWVVPAVLVGGATIFLAVHLSNRFEARAGAGANGGIGHVKLPEGENGHPLGDWDGALRVGSDGPTASPAPNGGATDVPTSAAFVHSVPLISDDEAGGADEALGEGIWGGEEGVSGGLEYEWKLLAGSPTPDPALLDTIVAETDPGDGSPVTLRWNVPSGSPTPDPAYLDIVQPRNVELGGTADGYNSANVEGPGMSMQVNEVESTPLEGSMVHLAWNLPDSDSDGDGMAPTPDPNYLKNVEVHKDTDGSTLSVSWNFPAGSPTPDPALLDTVTYEDTAPVTFSWNLPAGSPTPDPALLDDVKLWKEVDGSTASLKWDFPAGSPTPDPALLDAITYDDTARVSLAWNLPAGSPTPDPALLQDVELHRDTDGSVVSLSWDLPAGSPTPDPALLDAVTYEETAPISLSWNIPAGSPTPDPALLKDIKIHKDTEGSIVSLSWNIPAGSPTPDPALLDTVTETAPVSLSWNLPAGSPTPDPALLNDVKVQKSTDGSVASLSWNIPAGSPTPDPALLDTVTYEETAPISLSWNFPAGSPTPDPALLEDVKIHKDTEGSIVSLSWNIPAGRPTPDPALLETVTYEETAPVSLSWNIPAGSPTPDPALLDGVKVQKSTDGSVASLYWNIPAGSPTPDPALLDTVIANAPSEAPIPRAVELGTISEREDSGAEPFAAIASASTEEQTRLETTPTVEPNADKSAHATLAWGIDAEMATKNATETETEQKRPVETSQGMSPTISSSYSPPPLPVSAPSHVPPQISDTLQQQVFYSDGVASIITVGDDTVYYHPVLVTYPESYLLTSGEIPEKIKREERYASEGANGAQSSTMSGSIDARADAYPSVAWGGVGANSYSGTGSASTPGAYPVGSYGGGAYPIGGGGGYSGGAAYPSLGKGGGGGGGAAYFFGGIGGYSPLDSDAGPCQGMPLCAGGGCGCYVEEKWQPGYCFWPYYGWRHPTWRPPVGGPRTSPQNCEAASQIIAEMIGFIQSAMQPLNRQIHNAEFIGDCWERKCVYDDKDEYFKAMSHEDEAIYEIFYTNPIKCCGVVAEVGAGDGITHSTSHYFEKAMGWKSILYEADPEKYAQLEKNRPNAFKVRAAFCEAGLSHITHDSSIAGREKFIAPDGAVVTELLVPPQTVPNNSTSTNIGCFKIGPHLDSLGVTRVDVMIIRIPGDPLAVIMDGFNWNVRVDIWLIVMDNVPTVPPEISATTRDETMRLTLTNNLYHKADWDIRRWCGTEGCQPNEVFLREGFNPLPDLVNGRESGRRRLTENVTMPTEEQDGNIEAMEKRRWLRGK